ncbi:tetratricopeptide repeat protein [Streptomyces sp. NBC_01304]|uniref:tetratricopeptide repeat protein n=1 Tax=Streptomyces sp. NBC_01304 TaxID=2903818 RepID=UPI002E14FECF|nr:hypothetical protein OG430_38100 [Streptomyces sp. NBC_01304]
MVRLQGRSAVAVVALALALTAGAVAIGGEDEAPRVTTQAPAPAADPAGLGGADLTRAVAALQGRLRDRPKDFAAWAQLGTAYVEQARTLGDPSRYPQAERALDRSLALRPAGNDAGLAGRAALAAARHDFAGALRSARQALAVNAYNERALALRIDALVELGRYDEALKAARDADGRRPGIPVFTRFAYVLELRGDAKGARRVLKLALGSAMGRGDRAYVATELGQLAFRHGEFGQALRWYGQALGADPEHLLALQGRAAALAAQGAGERAVRELESVVRRFPLPGPLVALGELYEARGQRERAREQYALIADWTGLARAVGVNTDLDTALALADHGDERAALTAARAEWSRRRTLHTADALAWALHADGQDEEALRYARRATGTAFRDAAFLYHLGVIEHAVGDRAAARRSLSEALELNPGFSPTGARAARALLDAAGGAR